MKLTAKFVYLQIPDRYGNFTKPVPQEFLFDFMLPVQKTLPDCHAVIVNSVHELESEGIKWYLSKPGMKDVPFFCIGPVLPEPKEAKSGNATVEEKVSKWLNAKDLGSIAYISFGSVVIPNQN